MSKSSKQLICIYTNKKKNEFAIGVKEDATFRSVTKVRDLYTRFVDAFEKTLITNDINWQEELKKWVAAAKKNESIFLEIDLSGWNEADERRNKIISKTASIGGPAEILMMLDFCNRHAIEPIIEEFPLSRVNEALAHLESGKACYRIVLRNDFKYLE